MPMNAGTLPVVRRGGKSPTVYVIDSGEQRQMAYTRVDALRLIATKPDGSFIYLSRLGLPLRDRGVWVKYGDALVHDAGAGDVFPVPSGVARRNPRRNPGLSVMRANPPMPKVVATLSRRALALSYIHAEHRGQAYKHDFARGVTIQLLSDGSVRLTRTDGKRLWSDFPDPR